jgi:hypothetical protein
LVSATIGNTTSSVQVLVAEPVTPSFDLKAIFQRFLLRTDKTLRGVIEIDNDDNDPIFGRAIIAVGQITELDVQNMMEQQKQMQKRMEQQMQQGSFSQQQQQQPPPPSFSQQQQQQPPLPSFSQQQQQQHPPPPPPSFSQQQQQQQPPPPPPPPIPEEWRKWKSQQIEIAGRVEINYDLLSLFNVDVTKALAVQVYIQVTELASGQERFIQHIIPIFTRDVIYDIRPLEFEAGVNNEFEIICKRPDGKPANMEDLIVTVTMMIGNEQGKVQDEQQVEIKEFYTQCVQFLIS